MTNKTTPKTTSIDFTRAAELTPDVEAAIDDAFLCSSWNSEQMAKGAEVRFALASAVKTMIRNVPPCPDRSAAIRKIREARMDCANAIFHNGKY
jgi:hypothetical protein